MENLKCYRFQLDQDLGVEEIEIDYGSGYVKFSDIKDILNSTPNTAMPKCECEGFMSVRNVLIQICGTCNGVIVQ